MDATSLFFLIVGLVVLLGTGVTIVRSRRRGLDEIFEGITPGTLPRPDQQVGRKRVRESDYTSHVAVQFTPPDGLRPGLVGTVYDGEADSRDITATIVDLAVRGYVKIKAVETPDAPPTAPAPRWGSRTKGQATPRTDWEILALTPPENDRLSQMEAHLLNGMFAAGPKVRISDLTRGYGQLIRESVQSLYGETVARGWYPIHPRAARGPSGCALWGGTVAAATVLGLIALISTGATVATAAFAALAVLVAAVAWQLWGRVRPGRTAEGTAVRIQALGFQEYLATAEADQIKFEEAAEIFSRYLPYAIVFGVADHWAKVFGDIAAKAKIEGYEQMDFHLDWLDMFLLMQLLDVPEMSFLLADGLVNLVSDVDFTSIADGVTEGLGAFNEGVEGFMGSFDGVEGLGDGCDGCGDLDF